jgi:uncharacterized protein (TIGR00290 family)
LVFLDPEEKKMRVVCLWSGGKDSCFACYKAMQSGLDISYLMHFALKGKNQSLSHGLPSKLVAMQMQATGIPSIQKEVTRQSYTPEFKKIIRKLKQQGIKGIVFGDIYLQEHKDWIDRICKELKITAILPLWKVNTKKLILDFINCGFKTTIVTTKKDILNKDWLGRNIDNSFVSDLKKLNPKIDPCGECGEFHTFVTDGPLFSHRIDIHSAIKILKDGRWFLKIKKYAVAEK